MEKKGSTQYWVGLGVLWGRLLRGRGRGWEGAREGISIAAATHPPPGHCRHTLHLANIVPDQRMRGRNRKRTAGSKKRRMEGRLGKGVIEGYGGGQGALSSGAVPMLAALPASDKLLLFIRLRWRAAHNAKPRNMDCLLSHVSPYFETYMYMYRSSLKCILLCSLVTIGYY